MRLQSMIDIRDINTYGDEICDHLNRSEDIVRRYLDREIELEKIEPPKDPKERGFFKMPTNEHYGAYRAAVDFGPIMAKETFRAFHYSRMTADEFSAFLAEGDIRG